MAGLSATLQTLARARRSFDLPRHGGLAGGQDDDLAEISGFGANPGNLRLLSHVPPDLPKGAALVVVLHGCGQTAGGYARGAGWIELADRFGFALLLPEQRRANNAGGCFNWFLPEDMTRGEGEAASVRAMVQHMVTGRPIDPHRVFVTGLSAGGAFANVLLATYPEVFAGGAIVAGLPYGGASDVRTALDLMHRGRQRDDRAWGDAVRGATGDHGAWPRVAVWHGEADTTVVPANGTDVVRQWLDVHGLAYSSARRQTRGTATHLAWGGSAERPAVEMYTLPGFGHGVPISARDPDPDRRGGAAAAFIVEAGVPSAYLIAQSWGLIGRRRAAAAPAAQTAPAGVAGIIQKALRAAGLG